MSPPAAHWSRLFSLNADLLLNTLEGVGAEQGSTPVVAGGNTIAFLVAHLVDSRHFLAERWSGKGASRSARRTDVSQLITSLIIVL